MHSATHRQEIHLLISITASKMALRLFGGINYANNAFSQNEIPTSYSMETELHTDYQKAKARTDQWNANTGILFDYEENSIDTL